MAIIAISNALVKNYTSRANKWKDLSHLKTTSLSCSYPDVPLGKPIGIK